MRRPARLLAGLLALAACRPVGDDRVARAPEPAPVAARASQVLAELGDPAADVVDHADALAAARMPVIAAAAAQDATLTTDDTILGYPIEAPLVALDPAARAEFTRLALADTSYAFGLARRCENDYFVGVRLQRGPSRVEFALGVRCMQAIWAVRAGDEVRRAGAVMHDEAARAILRLLERAGVRDALRGADLETPD